MSSLPASRTLGQAPIQHLSPSQPSYTTWVLILIFAKRCCRPESSFTKYNNNQWFHTASWGNWLSRFPGQAYIVWCYFSTVSTPTLPSSLYKRGVTHAPCYRTSLSTSSSTRWSDFMRQVFPWRCTWIKLILRGFATLLTPAMLRRLWELMHGSSIGTPRFLVLMPIRIDQRDG